MPSLTIDAPKYKREFKEVANAVYKALNQTANLKAEVVFMSAEDMQKLNNETRKVDKVTDVLSYPTLDNIRETVLNAKDFPNDLDGRKLFIGSIVLCEDKIREQAQELLHSEKEERTYLTVHGLMHLFGYDHIIESDKKQMREKEKMALRLLGINQ